MDATVRTIWNSSRLILLGICGVATRTGGSENVTVDVTDVLRAPRDLLIAPKIRIAIALRGMEHQGMMESGRRYGLALEVPPVDTDVFRLQGNDLRGVLEVSSPQAAELIEQLRKTKWERE